MIPAINRPNQYKTPIKLWIVQHKVTPMQLCLGLLSCCMTQFGPVRQMASHLTLEYFSIQSLWLTHWKVPRLQNKTSSNRYPSTTVLDTWYEVFVLIRCVWIPLNRVLWVLAVIDLYFSNRRAYSLIWCQKCADCLKKIIFVNFRFTMWWSLVGMHLRL